jgi:hypothetical protein
MGFANLRSLVQASRIREAARGFKLGMGGGRWSDCVQRLQSAARKGVWLESAVPRGAGWDDRPLWQIGQSWPAYGMIRSAAGGSLGDIGTDEPGLQDDRLFDWTDKHNTGDRQQSLNPFNGLPLRGPVKVN